MVASATKKPRAKKAAAPAPVDQVIAYKAFNPDLTCRGFQYAIGETYRQEGRASLCNSGFHACEMPLDVWNYYPGSSTLAKVTLSGSIDRHAAGEGDSKVCGASITVDLQLDLPSFIKAAVAWVANAAKGNIGTGDRGHAAATGDRGHAAATGYRGHAAATGYRGHAAATGDRGHAAATGYRGHAAATGYSGHAAATGDRGHAAATGDRGHAAATGDRGHAAATGYRGHAAATGYSGHAAATGDSGIAAALGPNSTAKAGESGAIMLAHWDTGAWPYELVCVGAFMVGQKGVEAGKTYRLNKNGKPIEVKP